MEIDNSDIIMNHLSFVDPNDRYLVNIIRRPKDCIDLKNELGSNEVQRLIKTYYIESREYFERKLPSIRELCTSNHARAYFTPQVRDNKDCLLGLAELLISTIRLGNYSVKPEHILRSAYSKNHRSRAKRWVLDLDINEMIEYIKEPLVGGAPYRITNKEWTVTDVLDIVKKYVKEAGHNVDDVYSIPTKNGQHIITPPFNLQAAYKQCSLIFEGTRKDITGYDVRYSKPGDSDYKGAPDLNVHYNPKYKDITGWLHKDGLTLLYYNDGRMN